MVCDPVMGGGGGAQKRCRIHRAANGGMADIPSSPIFMRSPASTLSPKQLKDLELERFYQNYDPMEGLLTAVVLGGFFAFVCLMVVYKTKCKPMWKNRKKKLTNTPASMSVNNESFKANSSRTTPGGGAPTLPNATCEPYEEEEEEFEFECIPLKSVFTGGGDEDEDSDPEADDDIFFMDEYGNYVFPVPSSPGTVAGSCSCAQSADLSLASAMRRPSQGSAISAAYTVKSLPGAYLYIPILGGASGMEERCLTATSLSSIRRSLSDPEIHFSPPIPGQPFILTINASNEPVFSGSVFNNSHLPRSTKQNQKLQQRSHSIQPGAILSRGQRNHFVGMCGDDPSVDVDNDVIAIQVIQPTPNISPTLSLKSFSGDLGSLGASESSMDPPLIAQPPHSPTSSLKRLSPLGGHSKIDRRVSFSDDSAELDPNTDSDATGRNLHSPKPQSNRIPFMNYLQVPGQQAPLSFVVPQLTPEARIAQTSPQARKRRSTRLLKTSSFCSINSEGDGDIFGPTGELKMPEQVKLRKHSSSCDGGEDCNSNHNKSVQANNHPKSSLDPLSDYTEFHDDCRSDISELFGSKSDIGSMPGSPRELKNQGTFSDQEGSIKSLSIDQEDLCYEAPQHLSLQSMEDDERTAESSDAPTVVAKGHKNQVKSGPPFNNPEYDAIMQHQMATLTNEGDDDEICASSSCSISMGSENGETSHQITVPVTIEHPPPEMRCCSPTEGNPTSEEVHPFGSSTSQTASSLGAMVSFSSGHNLARQETLHTDSSLDTEEIVPASPSSMPNLTTSTTTVKKAPDDTPMTMRMVLVRDIGVQVCGDSPNLNMTRKYHEINPSTCLGRRRSKSAECRSSLVGPDGETGSSSENLGRKAGLSQAPKLTYSTEILF